MIKNIIFDFGDVFLNLDKKGALKNALKQFQIEALSGEMMATNCLYEQGLISTTEFVDFYINAFPELSENDMIEIWNYILIDFPKYKFDFLKDLYKKDKYRLVLLSNTNELHMAWVKQNVTFYSEFKDCFHNFYLSHEIKLRKPDKATFEFVLNENRFLPSETLFIDDTAENIIMADKLGIHTWNIDNTKEDIEDLFTIKKELF